MSAHDDEHEAVAPAGGGAAALEFDYAVTLEQMKSGLIAAPGFRRKLMILALLAGPSLLLLSLWPDAEWWMLLLLIVLLAFRALRVPARAARRALGNLEQANGSLRLDEEGIRASGVCDARATWFELESFSESGDSFQIEVSAGPVIIIPKSQLDGPTARELRTRGKRAPRLARWPVWAISLVALTLAAAILLSLQSGPLR